jgi:N-acylneuraminate cytidylyltransferase
VTTITVIHEVLREYRNQFNKIFDLVCCVYPTAPLIKIQHLKEGLELLNSKNYDSVYPVVSYGYPVWRGVEISKGGKSKMIWPEYQNYRSQDLKTVYHDAGQWYWMNIGRLKDSVFTQNSASIVLSESEVQDVDTYADWTLAELKYKLSNEV